MEGQELLPFLFVGGRKSYALFYKWIFRRDFLSPCIAIVLVSKIIPAPACLVALMIGHCCYRTKTFEACGPRMYQSENKLSPLLIANTSIYCNYKIKTKAYCRRFS